MPERSSVVADLPTGRVMVVGSANMDLVLRVPVLPSAGETVLGADVELRPGGKGANQAVAAALHGGQVSFAGCIGTDEYAGSIRAALAASGVDVHALRSIDDRSTGLAVVMVDAAGENAIAVSPGANFAVEPADLLGLRSELAAADVLLMQLELPLEVVSAAAEMAAEENTLVLLNLSPVAALEPSTLRRIDVLVVNRSEAEYLLGKTLADDAALLPAAQQLRRVGPAAVVITAGSAGAVFADAEGDGQVPAEKVAVVDTAGAGDAFAGALAVALARGSSLGEATKSAVRAGAQAVQTSGAQLRRGTEKRNDREVEV